MSRHFPNFVDAYVRYTQNQETSEKIHRWTALSIIAAALERKVCLNRGYYTLFPNLYVFIVGASGIVRKSTSTGIGVDLLRHLERFNIMSERLTARSLIDQLERSGTKFTRDGRDERQSAVFAYASELKVFLGEVFGSISDLLTTFFDCVPNDSSKPWTYENKGDGQINVYGPCLNILGASTPTWLIQCIPPTEMEGGFSSRAIFVVETDPPRKFVAWPEVDRELASLRPKLIDDLRRIHALVGTYRVSAEARAWFSAWYETHQRKLLRQNDSRFSGYFGRKGDTILKVAMSVAASQSDELVLREEHVSEAAALLDALEASMFDAFGNAGRNETNDTLMKILSTIRTHGRITHSALLRAHIRDTSHKGLVEIIENLRRMRLIQAITESNDVTYAFQSRQTAQGQVARPEEPGAGSTTEAASSAQVLRAEHTTTT
jgi:hypothetical protein